MFGFEPGDDFRKYIESEFDPKMNGFKVVKAGDPLPSNDDKEVWTDAPAILWQAWDSQQLGIKY